MAHTEQAPDLELLERWRAGDKEAGDRLFQRHFEGLLRFFYSKVDDHAEDLVLETLTAAVAGKDTFAGRSSFRTYLFGIARNKLYQHFRQHRRQDDVIEFRSVSAVDLGASPSSWMTSAEEQRLLLRALRRIPIDLQITVELFYWEGMSNKEIAAVFEIPDGTVRTRLTRARALLGEEIRQLASSPERHRTTMECFEKWARSLVDAIPPPP